MEVTKAPRARCAPSPHPNSSLPEFGTLDWPKSDISDFGWEREQTEFAARSVIPSPIAAEMTLVSRFRSSQPHLPHDVCELRVRGTRASLANVRSAPDSDRIADIAEGPSCARKRHPGRG